MFASAIFSKVAILQTLHSILSCIQGTPLALSIRIKALSNLYKRVNVCYSRKAIYYPGLQKWSGDGGNFWPEVVQITCECVCFPYT